MNNRVIALMKLFIGNQVMESFEIFEIEKFVQIFVMNFGDSKKHNFSLEREWSLWVLGWQLSRLWLCGRHVGERVHSRCWLAYRPWEMWTCAQGFLFGRQHLGAVEWWLECRNHAPHPRTEAWLRDAWWWQGCCRVNGSWVSGGWKQATDMTALIKFESDFWQEQPQLAAHAVLLACARSDHPRSVVGVRRQRAHVCDLSSQDTQAGPSPLGWPSRLPKMVRSCALLLRLEVNTLGGASQSPSFLIFTRNDKVHEFLEHLFLVWCSLFFSFFKLWNWAFEKYAASSPFCNSGTGQLSGIWRFSLSLFGGVLRFLFWTLERN